jgi:hypothetical protein
MAAPQWYVHKWRRRNIQSLTNAVKNAQQLSSNF